MQYKDKFQNIYSNVWIGWMGLIRREFLLMISAPQEWLNPIFFFILVVSLFPFAVSPDVKLLRILAPGVIWVAALLAMLISLERLFKSEHADGTLEMWMLSPMPLSLLACAKIFSHWLVTSLPLLILTPLLARMYDFSWQAIWVLCASLLIGMPTLILIGATIAALITGLRSSGTVLLGLLLLPLSIPVLIFGAGAATSAASGLPFDGQLAFLAALLALAISLCPFAIAGALKICVHY